MGLDTIEVVMQVEESFGIEIPDDDAQTMFTVGDLFEFVKSRTQLPPAGTCLTAATFRDIRKAIRRMGVKERFGPSTQLVECVRGPDRRSFWCDLSLATDLKLPDLVRPCWMIWLSSAIVFTGSLSVALKVVGPDFNGVVWAVTMVVCLVIFGCTVSSLTKPFATRFASDIKTFGDLSKSVLALNASTLQKRHGSAGPSDIWVILREIIVAQLGVDADEVVPSANFVKDLGC